jgi:hypothetical protein
MVKVTKPVTKAKPVAKAKPTIKPVVSPRINYQSDDALAQWHKEKTKSSMSEAFRDADYATPIWRCESDWDRTKEYLGWTVMWVCTLGLLYLMGTAFAKVMP